MAGKTFSIVFDASMNISQMTGAVKKIQSEFNKLQIGGSFQKKFTNLLIELDSAIKDFETKSGKEITSKRDIGEIESATRKIVNLYERLKIEAKTLSSISNKELQKLFPEDLEKNFKQVETYLGKYRELVEKNNKEIENKQRELKQAQEKLTKTQQKDAAKGKKKITAAEMRDLKNSQSQINKQRKKQQETIAQLEEEKNKRIESGHMRIKKDGTADKRYGDATENQDLLDRIQKAQIKLAELNESYNQVSNKISGSITETDYNENLKKIEGDIEEAQKAITNFEKEIADLKANPQVTESFENLRKEVEKLTGLDLSNITQDLDGFEKLKQIFDNFQTGKLEEARKKLEELEGTVRNIAPAVGDTEGAVRKTSEAFSEMSREAQDLARLQDQVLDFFSLSNTIQIFKNAIRDAFETVKELDAVMTETAVVTDFSIGDMWDKLPEYSTEANKLGTSIKSLYEATTLYYQQGLNSDQAMDVGIETMKMARIANMDAAAATEAMTAALRGFNMEINETNATRINDVYSELAAITAADTEQIATAMSKTASIADAANMEFETTAAFLAQIIETTQEAPETAGTAMKTIIARFTEVKELFDEGMLSGKDTEGEEININKIDAALKKVGISLNDFLKGEKGIDDIFLELASKWDTLDLATQRYIATTAAGSRQQSRFLAMMGNYDRTMELVTAANNSAGASQKQFDKTLESLEAKLQRLNNAWQEFTMGLANNEVIKAGVDLLTWLLETINKITGVAGNEGLGGMITMFARLVTVIGALKGGGAIIKNLISGMAKTGVFSKNTLGNMGLDEAGNWIKDISLMKILMNTLNVTTTESGVLFGKLGIEISKSATAFKLAGAAGASSGAAVTIGWLPVIGIIAGIIVVVWALVAAFKAAYAASPEGKLEAASAAAEGAAEAAEGAAQAYEHLAAALGSIGGKSAALENLAIGTTEWKNAVQELNGQVLDLVEQYPELAKFVDSSKGYLSFKEVDGKTVQDELKTYQDNKFKAQSASAAAKLQKQQAQQVVDFQNLSYEAKTKTQRELTHQEQQNIQASATMNADTPMAAALSYYTAERAAKSAMLIDQELTDELARGLAEGKISLDDERLQYLKEEDKELTESDAFIEFRKYGEGLVAADAATKVFTDSLLSNALMTAEVSEEQKSNMMNFLNSEQVNSQVDDMLNTITTNWTKLYERQQYKQDYADIMGYEYDKSKDRFLKDGQEVQVSDESIRRQMAGIYVQEELNKKMVALDGVLSGITDTGETTQNAFKAMTEKGEGAAMTLGELEAAEALNSNEIENLRTGLGLENVYTKEEFANFFTESTKLAREQFNKASEQLTTIGMGDYLADKNLDIGQTKAVSDLLYTTAVQSGTEAAGNLGGLISEQLKDANYGDIFAQALEMINVKDIDSVRKLSEYMEELGYTGNIDFDEIEEEIIKATNASKNFNLDNVKEQLKSTQDLVKDIKDREETDRIYSEEDYKKLIASGVDSKKFVMTGIDEYTYIGETNEQLVTALQENTAALLGETQEQLREAAEKSQIWEDLRSGEDTKGQYDLLGDIATGKTKIGEVSPEFLKGAMNAVGLSTAEFETQEFIDMLDESGGIVGDIAQILTDRIASVWNDYGSANAITGNLNAWETYGQQSLPQMYYSQMSGQQILNAQGAYKDEEGNVLGTEEDWAARKGALDAKLVQVDGGQAEAAKVFEDLRNQYENTAEAAERYETAVKAAVIDNDKLEKKMTSLADSIEDNADALKKGERGSKEYQKALDKIAAEAKAVFGENYTKEFVEENLPLFLDWAEGVEGSADKIRDALLNSTEASFNNIEQLRSNIAALDGTTLEIYGYANMSDAIGSLYQTEAEAAKAAADINALGMYSATVVSRGSHEENGIQVPNGWDVVVSKAGANVEGSRGGGGGGGGGGGEEEPWENPYDKLYNLTEKINQSLREREKLERRYERMIDRRMATAAELQRNSQAEIESLKEQAEYQQQMIDGRRKMMQEEMNENSDLKKYATINKETGEITINWSRIDSVTDEEEGSEIEEYISKLEELRDSMHEAQDALEDINDAVWEIEERGREEYMEFEDRVKEAIVASREKEIEALEKINESITDTNSELLDALQKSVDKMREDRENEETEKELTEKQRELAYLQQDTSGANAIRILELQEEIRQGKEDYTDTLIDQKISELQEQNDEAAEQREKQITLLQNQLDADIESGRIWAEVQDLMENGIDGQGSLINGSTLVNILKSAEGWDAMSEIGQMDWLSTLETMVAESMDWRMTHGQLENRPNVKSGDTITFKNANGKEITGTVDKNGNVWVDDSNYYKGVYEWIDGTYHTTETSATKYVKPKPASSGGGDYSDEGGKSGGGKQYPYTIDGVPGAYATPEDAARALAEKVKESGKEVGSGEIRNYTNDKKVGQVYASNDNSYVLNGQMHKYKTGGLADFTGPAWLDGTKSRPELVLNQRDTQNFIQLKDILSSIMTRDFKSKSISTENNGDITYDIDINVETMRSDYDVEQVASKIKSMINEDARYRNNNAVSLKR